MKKNKRNIFIIVVTTLLLAVAVCSYVYITSNAKDCDSGTNYLTTLSKVQNSNLLTDKMKDYVFEKNPSIKVEELEIVSSTAIDHGEIVMATFKSNNQLYESMFQTQIADAEIEERIIFGDFWIADIESGFTYHLFSGNVARMGEPKKIYAMIGGMINDDKIKSLAFIFNDGMESKIEVGSDEEAYCYTRIDKFDCISIIHAFDENEEVIYAYPPYPPKKK